MVYYIGVEVCKKQSQINNDDVDRQQMPTEEIRAMVREAIVVFLDRYFWWLARRLYRPLYKTGGR